jgi:hypothetical protein
MKAAHKALILQVYHQGLERKRKKTHVKKREAIKKLLEVILEQDLPAQHILILLKLVLILISSIGRNVVLIEDHLLRRIIL